MLNYAFKCGLIIYNWGEYAQSLKLIGSFLDKKGSDRSNTHFLSHKRKGKRVYEVSLF